MSTRIQEIKKKIAILSAELHREYHTELGDWYPKFPWVLIHVLPREQRIGSLWVPGDAKHQNKVTLEGVVVKIWKADHLSVKTSLKLGDHILFPHYAGQPVDKRSDEEFRLVREGFPGNNEFLIPDGEIIAKINYSEKEVSKEFWKEYKKLRTIYSDEAFEKLTRNFVIYPKESKTLSGV